MFNKLWLCAGLMAVLVSFNPKPSKPPKDIWEWNVPENTAKKMEKHVKECKGNKCRNYKDFTVDSELVAAIYEEFEIDEVTNPAAWITVRFRPADVATYKARHKIPDDVDGDVDGYTTQLLRVQRKADAPDQLAFANYSVLTRFYFDVGVICPPPDGSCK